MKRDIYRPIDPANSSVILLDPPPGRRWAAEDLRGLVGLSVTDGLVSLGVEFRGDLFGQIAKVDLLGNGKLLVETGR